MRVIKVCQHCKNLNIKPTATCGFCGYRHKSQGSAFVLFIVLLMVIVLVISVVGMRNLGKMPDEQTAQPASSQS